MNKTYEKIENYLRKNFPGKRLTRYQKLIGKTELYGFNGIQIKVSIKTNDIFYQIITLKEQLSKN